MVSIGVLIPTKNSAAYLPEHLSSMRSWLDLVAEVVVVDSFSTDGTLDMIRANLTHPRLTLLQHPPGLYQSWNFGLARLSTKYAYIATVGDLITRDGLESLFETAESLGADVVVSKPGFRAPDGQALPDIAWPIDDIIRSLQVVEPRRLDPAEALLFGVTSVTAAMTGSCASDLFRVESLRRFPFPIEFGTAGDGAWSILHSGDLIWGVVPDRFSSFLAHPSSASKEERASYQQAPRMDQVARQAVVAARKCGALSEAELTRLRVDELLDAISAYLDHKAEFDQQRHARLPWIVRPRAWRTRVRRNRSWARLSELRSQGLGAVAAQSKASGQPRPSS